MIYMRVIMKELPGAWSFSSPSILYDKSLMNWDIYKFYHTLHPRKAFTNPHTPVLQKPLILKL